jgi:hypothetical protein
MFLYDTLLNCLLDTRVRYVSVSRTVLNWYRNRGAVYRILSFEEVKRDHKKSDTIFVLGSGESINDIPKKDWDHIAKYDSFGLNWWPLHWFVPTFYYSNFPTHKVHFKYFRSIIGGKTTKYRDTIFFVSGNRAVRRGIHPRILPDFFRYMPLLCFYEYEEPVRLKKGELFSEESFKNKIYYRGGLSLVLDLINKMSYKNIVLLGVDLTKSNHFYDRYPEMKWQFETGYRKSVDEKIDIPHPTMDTKNGSKLPIDQYIYAVYDLYLKPRGIQVYTGSHETILAERLPVYNFPDK